MKRTLHPTKILLVVVAVLALILPYLLVHPTPSLTKMSSGGRTYELERVTTEAAREKGLGGRTGMAMNHGMLFVFDQPGKECFWMKDMQFPLDIIWLSSDKKVNYLVPNLSPETYPAAYCSTSASKYVIELNAGEIHVAGIHLGQTLQFE